MVRFRVALKVLADQRVMIRRVDAVARGPNQWTTSRHPTVAETRFVDTARALLGRREGVRFWCHLDDCLDPVVDLSQEIV